MGPGKCLLSVLVEIEKLGSTAWSIARQDFFFTECSLFVSGSLPLVYAPPDIYFSLNDGCC